MKLVGKFWFFIVILLLGSCFNPPEFPTTPEIEYKNIQFVDSDVDSLILTLTFHDGDGDLGLPADDPNHYYISDPYHNLYYFQETNKTDASGNKVLDSLATQAFDTKEPGTISIGTDKIVKAGVYDLIIFPNSKQGKLATYRTRQKAGFSYLPTFNCNSYEYVTPVAKRVAVRRDDASTIDKKSVIDSLLQGPTSKTALYYILQDTFLVKTNNNHYNIEVDFFVKEGTDFVEFDWRKEFCTQSFDGRFPVLTQKSGTALDGELKYTMNSLGFVALFSVKTLKLRFRIRDRFPHTSRWVETPEFTLDKIRRGP